MAVRQTVCASTLTDKHEDQSLRATFKAQQGSISPSLPSRKKQWAQRIHNKSGFLMYGLWKHTVCLRSGLQAGHNIGKPPPHPQPYVHADMRRASHVYLWRTVQYSPSLHSKTYSANHHCTGRLFQKSQQQLNASLVNPHPFLNTTSHSLTGFRILEAIVRILLVTTDLA